MLFIPEPFDLEHLSIEPETCNLYSMLFNPKSEIRNREAFEPRTLERLNFQVSQIRRNSFAGLFYQIYNSIQVFNQIALAKR